MSQDDSKVRVSIRARLATLERELDSASGYRLALIHDLVAAARGAYAFDMRLVRKHLANAKYIIDETDDPLSDVCLGTIQGMASNIMYWYPDHIINLNTLSEAGAQGYKAQDVYFNPNSLQIFRTNANGHLSYIGGASEYFQTITIIKEWVDQEENQIPNLKFDSDLVMFHLDFEECRYDEVGRYELEGGWNTPNLAHLRTLENKSQVTITIEGEEYFVTVFIGSNHGDIQHLRPDWLITGITKNGEPFTWEQGRDGGAIRREWK